MDTALLLIALGFGFKIFAEASSNNKKQLKQLGRAVGVVIMIVSAAGAACTTYTTATCAYSCQIGKCDMHGGKFGHKFGKGFMGKTDCPFAGKSGGQELPKVENTEPAQ